MPKILITGGLGFIGSHTCIDLVEKGYEIIILDSLINSTIDTLSNIERILSNQNIEEKEHINFELGDIRDEKLLNKIFIKHKKKGSPIDGVIHFAGLKSVNESTNFPLKYWDSNVLTSINLLKVMRSHDCKTIVFSSSATIYKPVLNEKLTEYSDKGPISPYGNSKFVIEKILSDLHKYEKQQWRIANLRYFNPVGAHPSGFLGEKPLKRANNLFPVINEIVAHKSRKLLVYGNDWPTRDGTCIRDYIHIVDLASAHVATLDFLLKNNCQLTNLNIGTGRGTSVLEIIQNFSKINKVHIPYEFTNRREGDTPFLVANNEKALKLLNWKPIKSIEDICRDNWNWVLKMRKEKKH